MDRPRTDPEKVVDPVCGMTVTPSSAAFSVRRGENTDHFCAEGCRRAFEADPRHYLDPAPAKPKGIRGRYPDRLNKATGGRTIGCCH